MTSTALVDSLVLTIRGEKVLLDADLALIYGVTTKRLKEQVKRNTDRFPEDFRFQLTREEAEEALLSRSQIATLKRGQNIEYLPHAFTEHGALMSANVLNSRGAVKMSVHVVRAFVKQRELMAGQAPRRAHPRCRIQGKRFKQIDKDIDQHYFRVT